MATKIPLYNDLLDSDQFHNDEVHQGALVFPGTLSPHYVTVDTEDDIPYLVEKYGAEDYLMIGTDYSHVDQSAEMRAHQAVMDMAARGDFSQTVATKIVTDNARVFYGV